ncbi:GHKL domain-containing protein [Aerococcaceae bacterium NML180378]|nr:GHKL domain-containing protein [Aerococcaceae bacterium NML180378]
MIPSSTIATIIDLFIEVVLWYSIFIYLFCQEEKKKKILIYCPTIIIGWVIGAILNDFFGAMVITGLVYMLLLYVLFFKTFPSIRCINKILLFVVIEKIIAFFTNFPVNIAGLYEFHQHIFWILFSEIFEMLLSILFFNKIYPIILNNLLFEKANKEIFITLLSYKTTIALYYIYMHHTGKYNHFLLITFLIITLSTVILGVVFVILKKYFDARYKEQLSQQQLNSMVQYTEVIERNQLQLRRFKHDYKNILLAMITMVEENKIDELKQYMASLTEYSQHHLTQSIEQYRDLHNIRHQLLKSMITMKLMELDSLNISFTFECLEPIEQLAIDDFDLVRMVGILLDNAKEYIQEIGTGHVNFLIIKTDELIEISIANTYLSDDKSIEHFKEMHYSSKSGHDGLGLSNIEEIKQKYDNIFIQYEKNDTFTVKIILLNHEGR